MTRAIVLTVAWMAVACGGGGTPEGPTAPPAPAPQQHQSANFIIT
jgi:hypothetical protein